MHGELVFIEISIILEGMVMNALTFIWLLRSNDSSLAFIYIYDELLND